MTKLILFLSLCVIYINNGYTQNLPVKQEILNKMELANNYFINKWPDPTANIVTDKSRPSNLWTRGTYYEGLMQLYYITLDNNLYKYALDWGNFHQWQPTYTGTTPTRIADNQCCGQTYLELYQLDTTKTERVSTIQKSIDAMVNSTKVNDWWWIDAIHMAMPVFTKLGVIKKDERYFEKMYDLFNYTKSQAKGVGLYNSNDSLWYRDSVYLPPKTSPNGLPVYWSRGNGWVFAALTRTLDILPVNAPHRDEYISIFKQMAGKLIKIQRTDGFWNCNLGDPNDFGGKESSGTVFFTYGLAWGINHNILDSALYIPFVAKAWNGLVNDALHLDGSIGYMQSSGSKPSDGQPLSYDKMPNFEDFGLGGFLLAGSEVYKLAKNNYTDVEFFRTDKIQLSAYPNPFSHSIHIYIDPLTTHSTLKIINSEGKVVLNKNYDTQQKFEFIWNGNSCNNTRLPNGIYVIIFDDGNNSYSEKVVLNK